MNIDTTLAQSLCDKQLAIDQEWGLSQLNTFLSELVAIEKGVPFEQLGIGERRAAAMPGVIQLAASDNGRDRVSTGIAGYSSFKNLLKEETPPGSIALLNLKGVIRSESALSTRGVDSFLSDLELVYSNPNFIGAVVRVNSGGGESVASFQLRSAIKDRNKPVVALVDYAASGAYLAITGADEIIGSHDAAQFGSIGAYISINKEQLIAYTEEFIHVYADQSTEKNAPIRQAAAGDFSGIKKVVNQVAADFIGAVKADRVLKGSEDIIGTTLAGGMFSTVQAKRRGLADLTGNLNTAIRRIDYYARQA